MVQTTATAAATTATADDAAATAGDGRWQHATSSSVPATTSTSAADGCWRLWPRWYVPRPAAVYAARTETKSRSAGRQCPLPAASAGPRWSSDGSSDPSAHDATAADANRTITAPDPISTTTAVSTGRSVAKGTRTTIGVTPGATVTTPFAFPFASAGRSRW